MAAGVPQKVKAYGTEWNFSEIARVVGVSREAIRQHWVRGGDGEELFRGVFEKQDDAIWRLGLSVRQWQRIVDYAQREGKAEAADVYGVPLGAVEDALAGRWHLLD